MTRKAKRVVTKFNFDKLMQSGNKAHVALVDAAANEQEVLVLKAKAPVVKVEMEMTKFLEKFFGLWDEDAEALVKILGYDDEEDEGKKENSYDEATGMTKWVGDGYTNTEGYIVKRIGKVSLLKGKEVSELSPDMVELIKSLQETVGDLEAPSVEGEVDTLKHSTDGETTMNEEEILAMQAELADLKKAKEATDGLVAELAELKKAKEDKRAEDMTDLVKGLSFVAPEAQEELVAALLKSADAPVLVVALEKAREAVLAVATVEDGHDEEGEIITDTNKANDAVSAILAARNKK